MQNTELRNALAIEIILANADTDAPAVEIVSKAFEIADHTIARLAPTPSPQVDTQISEGEMQVILKKILGTYM